MSVCECWSYQISIYHHTSSKTLLMPSPQCILTILSYKTNPNSGGNSRYTQARPHQTARICHCAVFCLLNAMVGSENSGLNQQLA